MTSPYLTADDAATYVGAKSRKAFDHWVTRRGVPIAGRRGRIRLFAKATLDRVLAHDARPTLRKVG